MRLDDERLRSLPVLVGAMLLPAPACATLEQAFLYFPERALVATPADVRRRAGTTTALAPEELDGAPPDRGTDVYGLGLLLHELVTLRPPLAGGAASLGATLRGAPPLPRRAHGRRVPWELRTIVARATAVDRA